LSLAAQIREWATRFVEDDDGMGRALRVTFAFLVRRRLPPGVARDRAEDAVQEALVRVLAAHQNGAMSCVRYQHFVNTVCRVAVHWLISEHRRRRGIVALLDDEVLAPEGDTVAEAETCAKVREAVDRLAPEERELVRLRYEEGLTLEDLAARGGCSVATVWRRLQQIQERLRRELLGPEFEAGTS
jgi:RNA polymerase sigma factor (sigma-70 family)